MFEPRKNEVLNLRDFVSLLKSIKKDELVYLEKEFSLELRERNSVIFDMIPGIVKFYSSLMK